ncbi:prepilin-type N-terminal cleavage/methylation domain-containing protein [Salmonella enterica subsp. enterica]|uniref:Prepilin-type N-terminal cleavage/methylation domain-containing protein n=3 Tax=Salmonella enterica TaxID=28901 RepID=A0A744EQ06_SALER|nr:type IV prepilin [Salmonella enterica subsp. enterica serovar Mikawasima]EAZ0195348.1 prepilin-type N-terminal cleavage/methylation domain-containing protein [Salmonella enterica]EBR8657986.1 type IV prepilin [Salmonella enterica subsp. enterica serovar Kottbus]EBX6497352.1 type IV prepilin [Salmonella enterica subsp. enterica serovar Abony]EBY1553878.1 prepilin-type N-terminal cleavage/methylation domain-containing protein [Salmonella enterica subsp. enterica serovar Hofit]EDW0521384.1 pre
MCLKRKLMAKLIVKEEEKRSNEDGFTLIEAMVVMIVGVMVLAGAAAGINKLFVANNVSTEAQNIQSIAANMKTVASSEGGYDSIAGNKEAIDLHVFPTNMKVNGTDVRNVWGGSVTVAGTTDSYTLTYPSVPAEECIQIASKLRNASWDSVATAPDTASGSDATANTGITPTTTLADIQTACGTKGKVIFTFVGH